jgi:hypothetical protein
MRHLLKTLVAAVLLPLALVSCKKSSRSEATTTNTAANPDPIVITSCSSATGIDKILCLTEAFKSQLDATQLATLQRSYSKADAQKWSNLPQALYRGRVGLNFGSMTTVQIQYAKALIKEVAGSTANEGWDEIQQLLNADEYLSTNGGGTDYGAANYYITFLGTPALTGTFEIQFGGHHLAFANTYKDGVLTGATPSFRGVEPFTTFTVDGKTNQPLQQEQVAFSALLTGLSSANLSAAKLSATYSDLLVGPQKDAAFPATPSGVKGSNLSAAERALVLSAIKTYVYDVDDVNAATILAKYTSELDNTYISYSGTTAVTAQNDYVRIDGPSVWIEYSSQHGIVLQGNHPHSVWRDKTKDYGGN